MPRKRDVNLSHCGNAISRMWAPFGWVGDVVEWRDSKIQRQSIRCLLPPNQIFPAAKWGWGVGEDVQKHEPPPKWAAAGVIWLHPYGIANSH